MTTWNLLNLEKRGLVHIETERSGDYIFKVFYYAYLHFMPPIQKGPSITFLRFSRLGDKGRQNILVQTLRGASWQDAPRWMELTS